MKDFTHLEAHHIHELSDKTELVKVMTRVFVERPLHEDLSPPRFALGHFHKMGVMPELSRLNPLVLQTKMVSLSPGQGHEGYVFRFDAITGKLLALISGKIFTSYRTAASSVAVAQKLRPQAKNILLLGTGEQALRHLEFFSLFYPQAKITIVGRSRESLKQFQEKANMPTLQLTTTTPERSADIICTLTAASTPLLSLEQLKADTLLIAIGSCLPTKRELSSGLVLASARFVDSLPQAKREAGDFLIPLQEKTLDENNFATEIGALFREEVASPSGHILFKSLGLAEQDIAYSDYLLEKFQS